MSRDILFVVPTIPRGIARSKPPAVVAPKQPVEKPKATPTESRLLRVHFGTDDEPPEHWDVLRIVGTGAQVEDYDAFRLPEEDERASRTRWAQLPVAEAGTASVAGAAAFLSAYAVRDPDTGCGWVACWVEEKDEPEVQRSFEKQTLKQALKEALREADEVGAGIVGSSPAPFSSYDFALVKPPGNQRQTRRK